MENVYFGAAKLTLDEITFACRDLLPLDYSWWIAKHTHVSASHATPFQRPSKSQRNGIHCHLCVVPHRLVFVQTCTKSSFYGVPDPRARGPHLLGHCTGQRRWANGHMLIQEIVSDLAGRCGVIMSVLWMLFQPSDSLTK